VNNIDNRQRKTDAEGKQQRRKSMENIESEWWRRMIKMRMLDLM